jgi:hypothetical protein
MPVDQKLNRREQPLNVDRKIEVFSSNPSKGLLLSAGCGEGVSNELEDAAVFALLGALYHHIGHPDRCRDACIG